MFKNTVRNTFVIIRFIFNTENDLYIILIDDGKRDEIWCLRNFGNGIILEILCLRERGI